MTMGNMLINIQKNRQRFLITMIIIMASATLLNYGIFSFLKGYFDTVETVYNVVQLNIITCVVVIGAVTVLMMLLIPKKSIDNMLLEIDSDHSIPLTPEQELQNMIDYELEKKD